VLLASRSWLTIPLLHDPIGCGIGIAKHLTRPDADDGPTGLAETPVHLTITFGGSGDFLDPPSGASREELSEALTSASTPFVRIAVPKVTIDKYSDATRPNDNVRTPRNVFGVQSVTRAARVQGTAKSEFGFRILATNSAHHAARDRWIACP